MAVAYGIDQQGGKGGANYTVGVAPTLASDSHGTPHGVAYSKIGVDLYNGLVTGETAVTVLSESCITSTRVGPFVMESLWKK